MIRVLTLNLHGYHPMGEAPRWWRGTDGSLERATDHPFFFRADELARGNRRRLDALAAHLAALRPDLVFLQEVAADSADRFFEPPRPEDDPGANTALRLAARRPGYQAALVLRGNRGWITGPETFTRDLVIRRGDEVETLFRAGDSPWPNGMLVEGFALLTREPWTVIENLRWDLPYNRRGDRAVCQAVALQHGGSGRQVLAVNLHAGHKLAHLEQSLVIRLTLTDLARDRGLSLDTPVIIAGDFNSMLYRPASPRPAERFVGAGQAASQAVEAYIASEGLDGTEPSAAFWEAAVSGQFDLREPDDLERLHDHARRDNLDPSRKPWASVDATAFETRWTDLMTNWHTLASHHRDGGCSPVLVSALDNRDEQGLPGVDDPSLQAAPDLPYRIDHILHAPCLRCRGAAALFTGAWAQSLETVSDHPAICADLAWT